MSASKDLLKNEPVLVGGFVFWLFSIIGSLITNHTDLVSASQWESVSTYLIPIVSAAAIAGIAWIVRKYVSPLAKNVKTKLEGEGIPDSILNVAASDAENAVATVIEDKLPTASVATTPSK
jgi:hypothetical protein